jgi:hypothetical protein
MIANGAPEPSLPNIAVRAMRRLIKVVRSSSNGLLSVLASIGRPLKLSSQLTSRLALLTSLAFALTFIQVDEYLAAELLFAFTMLIWVAKAIHWTGLNDRPRLTRFVRLVCILVAVGFLLLLSFWTEAKRGDKPWSSLQRKHSTASPKNNDQPSEVTEHFPPSYYGHPSQQEASDNDAKASRGASTPKSPEDANQRSKQYHTSGSKLQTLPGQGASTSSSEGATPPQPFATSVRGQEQGPSASGLTASESPETITLELTDQGPHNIDATDADALASSAQRTAAQILNCLVVYPSGSTCTAVHGTAPVAVRDELHNHGIDFVQLNDSIRQLETAPSIDVLRHTANVLRAVADRLRKMAQTEVGSTSSATEASAAESPESLSLELTGPGPHKIDATEADRLASRAQKSAADILNCFAAGSSLKECVLFHGKDPVLIRDDLHNLGIEFVQLNDATRQLESAPSVEVLKHTAKVLRAVADRLRTMSRTKSGASSTETIPASISITLPPEIRMRKGHIRSLAKSAGGVATTIDECIPESERVSRPDDREVVGRCLNKSTYYATDHMRSVAEEIHYIRIELGNAGVVVEGLEDVVERIRRGPSKEELRYTARYMDALSQELTKRAQ